MAEQATVTTKQADLLASCYKWLLAQRRKKAADGQASNQDPSAAGGNSVPETRSDAQ